MKNKTSRQHSTITKEMVDLMGKRGELQKEKEQNRKRLMEKQLYNVIGGNNKIVITSSK